MRRQSRISPVPGGLACAVACRREGLDVVLLEKANELSEVPPRLGIDRSRSQLICNVILIDRCWHTTTGVTHACAVFDRFKALTLNLAKRKSSDGRLGSDGQPLRGRMCSEGTEFGASLVRREAVDFQAGERMGEKSMNELSHTC